MEDTTKLLEALLDRATEYGKTSLELAKLQALDKASDAVSTFVPHTVALVVFACSMLFLNVGAAFWLGELLGKLYYGFFVVAGFYLALWLIVHFLMHHWFKTMLRNYMIEQVLD